MRSSSARASSTGDTLFFATRGASRSMGRKTNSSSFMRGCAARGALENLFLAPQVSERADIGDDERDPELVLGAHRAERQPPVLESDAAARAVVAHLDELVLQELLADVVAEAQRRVPPAAVQLAVAHERADLVRARLEHGVGIEREVRQRDEEL